MSNDVPNTDQVYRFTFDDLPIRGQWVRLKDVLSSTYAHHEYPAAIRQLLAEQLASVSMFADTLKIEGSVALQSRGEGRLMRSLAECRSQHLLRAIAHIRDQDDTPPEADLTAWLGRGQLALTLIPELQSAQTYQGMIELTHSDLATDLEQYFLQSEQLPTRIFFAHHAQTITGLLLQRLPDTDLGHEISTQEWEEAWSTMAMILGTLTSEELATLAPERFLKRMFNEFPCRLQPPRSLQYKCTCSRQKTDRTLLTFSAEELHELIDERSRIDVDCEFCGARYEYDAVDVDHLLLNGSQGSTTVH